MSASGAAMEAGALFQHIKLLLGARSASKLTTTQSLEKQTNSLIIRHPVQYYFRCGQALGHVRLVKAYMDGRIKFRPRGNTCSNSDIHIGP